MDPPMSITTCFIEMNLEIQIDEQGRSHTIRKERVRHQSTSVALKRGDPVHWMGSRQPTTAMWEGECWWKDGTTSLVLMRNLEALTLLKLIDDAVSACEADEHAFSWRWMIRWFLLK
jgi:hypothetical protein